MKAKNIITGEIINFIGSSKEWGTITYIDSNNVLRQCDMVDGAIQMLEDVSTPIDWELRRYELTKDIACAYMQAHPVVPFVDIAKVSVNFADELIKALRAE